MTTPLTPGVYVREAAGGARSIEAAPTAVAIFAGETERGPVGPTPITSENQFNRIFGGYLRNQGASDTARLYMPFAVKGFFDNGGPRAYVLRLVSDAPGAAQAAVADVRFVTVTDGVQSARIYLNRPPVGEEEFRVIIANATDADVTHFNLRLQSRQNSVGAFVDVVPNFTNLLTDAGDPAFASTAVSSHPDMRWDGPVFRPNNAAAADNLIMLNEAGATIGSSFAAWGEGVWGNGLRIVISNAADGDPDRFNLTVFYQAPGEAAHSEVEAFQGLSADPMDEKYMIDQLARSAFLRFTGEIPFRPINMGDAQALPPGIALIGGAGGDASVPAASFSTAFAALDGIDDAALMICGSDLMLNALTPAEHNGAVNAVLGYVENRPQRDLFLVADAPDSTNEADPVGAAVGYARNDINASDHMGLYWPRVIVADPIGLGRNPQVSVPAAGHIAGLYGRTDGRKGVWKLGAGVDATLTGVSDLDYNIIDRDQDRMNPHGLNAVRTIPGAGRVIWGGRTRRPTGQWRYINVRRTAMFLRRSIYNSIQWAVFEGNDENLWATLRASIDAFMSAQHRNGAFAGETAREAYFVKCDSDTTPREDQAAGIVHVLVGFAPLRPAEFVIVTLSQKTSA